MDKRILNVIAERQRLSCSPIRIASNTVRYVEAVFDLRQGWDGFDEVKAVWFTGSQEKSTLLDSSGVCEVPTEVLAKRGKVNVNLVGSVIENNELVERLTTYPIKAIEVEVDALVDGTETEPITPSQFEQFVEIVKDDADRAEQASEDSRTQADRSEEEADRAEDEADNALASAQNAHASELRASGYASDAQQSAESAQGYAQNASESAVSAENAKDDAEDARDLILGMRAVATILPEGSEPTARFENGVLYLGIPKGDTGEKGDKGNTGDAAGFGTVTATIDANVGTPSVEVTASGADTAKNFSFVFHNMKGNTGDTGNGIASIALKSTSGSVKTYTITMTNGSTFDFDVTDGEVTNDTLAEILEEYAKKIGYYEDLSAGTADQLTTDECDEDSELYILRKTGNGAEVHDKEYLDKIIGGTVAWNQQIPITKIRETRTLQGVLFTNNMDGSVTLSGTANGNVIGGIFNPIFPPVGHKVIFTNADVNGINWRVVSANSSGYQGDLGIVSGNVYNFTFYPQMFDLTQMFGSTIADYIYSLEQANAGAGVAWFRNLFPKEYYEYDSGSLKSVEGLQSHDTTGFNQWDEEWESGDLEGTNGTPVLSSNYIRSKNFCPCLSNTEYFCKKASTNTYVFWYDENKTHISHRIIPNDMAVVSPSGASYFKLTIAGTTYNHDISINYPSTDHDYHAYNGTTHTTSLGRTVYGGTLDVVSGELVVDMIIADLGDATWNYNTSLGNIFIATTATLPAPLKTAFHGICSQYEYGGVYTTMPDKSFGYVYGDALCIKDSAYTDATAFKTAMSGAQLCYELATPQTYQLTPTEVELLKGTNNIWTDSGEVEVTYKADVGLYIDKKLN